MSNFDYALQKVLINEGGYVNDSSDSGKETYKGISRRWHSGWDGWSIIDNHKKLPNFPNNLDSNTDLQTRIRMFYLLNFWTPINGDNITDKDISYSIFDFAVNCSPMVSIILSQKIIGVTIDGIPGNQTISKINEFNIESFKEKFTLQKIMYYICCVKKNLADEKFFFNWVCRSINGI